jgi:hypothetical protein
MKLCGRLQGLSREDRRYLPATFFDGREVTVMIEALLDRAIEVERTALTTPAIDRDSVIEECAMVADERATMSSSMEPNDNEYWFGSEGSAKLIAREIRALKAKYELAKEGSK